MLVVSKNDSVGMPYSGEPISSVGEVRRVAAARKAGDLDVRAGLAAGGFRPHAR